MLAVIIGSVHLIAVLAVIVGLLIILMASAPAMTAQDLTAINRVYLITGIALLIAAGAGGVLWFAGGKPANFYSNNPVFHAKLGLFIVLLAVVIYTGLRFRQLQKVHMTAQPEGPDASSVVHENLPVQVSTSIMRIQKICIPLMIVIPALAWMMARGIGL